MPFQLYAILCITCIYNLLILSNSFTMFCLIQICLDVSYTPKLVSFLLFLENTSHNDTAMIHIICILLVICYPLYISIVQTSPVNMLLHAFFFTRKNISNSLISNVNDLHNLHNIFFLSSTC